MMHFVLILAFHTFRNDIFGYRYYDDDKNLKLNDQIK